jgi:uncharacterized membrane protein
MKPFNISTISKIKQSFNFWSGIQISLGLFGLLVFALRKLTAGLLLDETITAWVIRDGILSTFSRSLHYQGQSPLYFFMIGWWTNIFGTSELAFRTFSFTAFLFGIVFIYFIQRRRFSPELSICGSIISGVLLLLYSPVLDARPYGFATAFLIASYYYFLVWLDTRSANARILNLICVILTIYFHWLYGTVLIVQTLLIFNVDVPNKRRFIRQWIINIIIVSILCSPNIYQIFLVFIKRFVYNWLTEPDAIKWALITFPIHAIILSILPFSILVYSKKIVCVTRPDNLFYFGLSWMIIPPSILFLISSFGVSILSPKYSGHSCAIGLVIISLLSCISVSFTRRITSLFTTIIAVLMLLAVQDQGHQSWREPISILKNIEQNDTRPILLSTGLIELNSKEWIKDFTKKEYLSAPIQYYLPSLNYVLVPMPIDLDLIEDTLVDIISELQRKGFYLLYQETTIRLKNDTLTNSTEAFKSFFLSKGFLVDFKLDISGINIIKFYPNEL